MAKEAEIKKLYEEAIRLGKFSKSKVGCLFWRVIGKLEKLIATAPDTLDSDQIKQLNALKRKF